MACYHDKQDFKSDLNIEVAREGDILQEGQDLKDIKCDKNPRHRDFIPFKDLTLEHLPNEHRNREILDSIKMMGSRVVRLVVDKIVNGRLIKEAGSGCVIQGDNYFIQTNNHVVGTEDDVKHCTVEFNYDSKDRTSVLTSYGVELEWTCPTRDVTHFKFRPVPDFLSQLEMSRLMYIVIMYNNNQITTMPILFYHGKHSFYSPLNPNSSLTKLMFISLSDSSISYLKSCYFKFEPIPSNRPLFTAIEILFCYSISSIKIEIHIDEDDGNSRVIPGDVVQFGDGFVVKISESIFQDEVKKCRLVWNSDIIGRGTRLYFQPVKSSEVLSGIDLQEDIEDGTGTFWILEFHPIPRTLEAFLYPKRSKHICCIGHPHGGIKMVTFGRSMFYSHERFDNQYRHITQPNSDCQCKEVYCFEYSCKTCHGSSGSPIFQLFEGMDWARGSMTHFMGKRVKKVLIEGDLIENVNFAWYPFPES